MNFSYLVTNNTLGNSQPNSLTINSVHISILDVLNNLMKNQFTVKSSDCSFLLSKAYSRIVHISFNTSLYPEFLISCSSSVIHCSACFAMLSSLLLTCSLQILDVSDIAIMYRVKLTLRFNVHPSHLRFLSSS